MSQPKSSSVRPYYIFTAVVLGCGAVASVFAESWASLGVFVVLCGMAVWVAARVGGPVAPSGGAEGGRQRKRPSERRRERQQRGG